MTGLLRKFLFKKHHMDSKSHRSNKNKEKRHRRKKDDDFDCMAVLNTLKSDFLELCLEPRSLVCPILYSVPTDPVVSIYGTVFSAAKIKEWVRAHHNCPNTRKPLTVNNLNENIDIYVLVLKYHEMHAEIVKLINGMTLDDEVKVLRAVQQFNEKVQELNGKAEIMLYAINQEVLIGDLKNKLKIDIYNPEHMRFWHHRSDAKLDKCVEVTCPENHAKYRMPKAVYQLMLVANNPYAEKKDIVAALNACRAKLILAPTFLEKPLGFISARLFRPPAGSEIIHAENIEKIDLSKRQ